jgi:hypothetical protein
MSRATPTAFPPERCAVVRPEEEGRALRPRAAANELNMVINSDIVMLSNEKVRLIIIETNDTNSDISAPISPAFFVGAEATGLDPRPHNVTGVAYLSVLVAASPHMN